MIHIWHEDSTNSSTQQFWEFLRNNNVSEVLNDADIKGFNGNENLQAYIEEEASGEAYILYLLACKAENKKICTFSVLEIMGSRLQNIVYEQFKDYSGLTIVTFNAIVPRKWEVER